MSNLSRIRRCYCYLIFTMIGGAVLLSCDSDDSGTAPYNGSPEMAKVQIESGTFNPQITWIGGFSTIVGVNKGDKAVLDTSLIWIIKMDDDKIRYPIKFGELPAGAENIIDDYGGTPLDSLSEDNLYTYWVMKADLWNAVSNLVDMPMEGDSDLPAGSYETKGDTLLKVSQYSFTATEQAIDVYVNVTDVKFFGKLADIDVSQPVDAHGPLISWTIIQEDVTDTVISAIGIVKGQQYSDRNILWDMWSYEQVGDEAIYGKKNVITGPLYLGDEYPETRVFNEFPLTGLERNEDYYIWIGNKDWNGTSRFRVTKNYAYTTFRTW